MQQHTQTGMLHKIAHELSLVDVLVGMINNLTAELAMIKYARLVQTQEQSFGVPSSAIRASDTILSCWTTHQDAYEKSQLVELRRSKNIQKRLVRPSLPLTLTKNADFRIQFF